MPTPVASISATPAVGTPPSRVAFSAAGSTSDEDIVSYAWSFGDGSDPVITEEPLTVHTYLTAGTYTATVTVTDAADETSTVSTRVVMTTVTAPAIAMPSTRLATEVWYDYVAFAEEHVIGVDLAISALREATFILGTLTDDEIHGRRCWRETYSAPVSGVIDVAHGPIAHVASVEQKHNCSSGSAPVKWCQLSERSIDVGSSRMLTLPGNRWPHSAIAYDYRDIGACNCSMRIVVNYTQASTLFPGTDRVAKKLAEEYLKAREGKPCQLPERISSVTRQGMSWTILDPQDFLTDGLTGIAQVDHWLSVVKRRTGGLKLRDPLRGNLLFSDPINCTTGAVITDAGDVVGSDWSPAFYPISRTAGDTMRGEPFELDKDGKPWVVDSGIAQVRTHPDSSAPLVMELSVSVNGDTVLVGDGDVLPATPGTYYWDLQVTDADGPLTIMWGTFELTTEVST